MTDDDRDNAGVVAPPPLIYLGPLFLVLLLKRKFRFQFFRPRLPPPLGGRLLAGDLPLMGVLGGRCG